MASDAIADGVLPRQEATAAARAGDPLARAALLPRAVLVFSATPAALAVARCCASAALYAAAFPPLAAAACGLLWGVLVQLGTAWWFAGTLAAYFGVAAWLGWIGFFACATLLVGVWTGAFAAWVAWRARAGRAAPLVVALGFAGCELVRASLALGIPWALAGSSQVPWTTIVQVADLGGPYAVGFLVAAVNACLAALVAPELRGRRFAAQVACTAALLAAAVVYGGVRSAQPFADGARATVSLVQTGVGRRSADRSGAGPASFARSLALTRDAASAQRPDLVLWPEFAVDFYLQEDSNERRALRAALGEGAPDLLLGGPHYGPDGGALVLHNSMFLWRDGALAGRYDKQLPLPFAERRVLGLGARRRSGRGGEWYAPGKTAVALDTRAGRVAVLLCSEGMDPALARAASADGATLLANPANDAWFSSEVAARQQLDVASLRAIENRRYLVRPSATGGSAVVDPHGRVIARGAWGRGDVVTAEVRASRARTPYQRLGDLPLWAALALLAALDVKRRRKDP